jgi:hypothetical protein
MPPDLLAQIVDQALREHSDMEVRAWANEREAEAREWLRREFEQRFGGAS